MYVIQQLIIISFKKNVAITITYSNYLYIFADFLKDGEFK